MKYFFFRFLVDFGASSDQVGTEIRPNGVPRGYQKYQTFQIELQPARALQPKTSQTQDKQEQRKLCRQPRCCCCCCCVCCCCWNPGARSTLHHGALRRVRPNVHDPKTPVQICGPDLGRLPGVQCAAASWCGKKKITKSPTDM